jgi:hypothetical protein
MMVALSALSCSGDACFCSGTTPDCTASGWGGYFLNAVLSFSAQTNLTMLETDGPYAGYPCFNDSHAGHAHGNAANAIALQSRSMATIYAAVQSAGIYVNAPDSWFPFGINKSR